MSSQSLLQTLEQNRGLTWRIISGPGAGTLVRIASINADQVITVPLALQNAHSFIGLPAEFAALHSPFTKPTAP